MSIPAQVCRLSIVGTFPNSEIWNHSLWFMPDGSGEIPADNDAAAAALANILASGSWTTYRDTLKTYLTSDSAITGLKLYCYPTGGPSSPAIAEVAISVAGTSSGTALPLQCTLVASLRTGQSGRSYRGRIYLPTVGVTLPANHQISDAVTLATANMVWDFIDGMITESILDGGDGLLAVVVSTQLSAKTPITSVVVDSVVDTQRRRRNRQSASFRRVVGV
jgi:hypothetical protein